MITNKLVMYGCVVQAVMEMLLIVWPWYMLVAFLNTNLGQPGLLQGYKWIILYTDVKIPPYIDQIHFEIKIENPFLFLQYGPKRSTKKMRTVIIYDCMRKLHLEMISDIRGKNCTFTFMHFLVGVLSQVRNHFQKQFFLLSPI